MRKEYEIQLEDAKTLADVFEVVKAAVLKSTGKSRGGVMLGLADLGNHPRGLFGGFFTVGSNVIVMNKIPLQRIRETRPELYKPYAFFVLLHEYIHTLGYLDEALVRSKVFEIARDSLGEDHPATRIAADISGFLKDLVYPEAAWRPDDERIEIVKGFDRSSVPYIG
ncbi:MAG TPA: hypothetical protein PLM24_10435 [Methanothrix sp.]|nr:hypothetical protein [Methanothrix sp.]HPJ83873.1 hypothetical protein [Methanothrix sp.]HPR67537.1 hypothetical protein [Methanothrix sp.]